MAPRRAFYFVGERPSHLAVTIGATWQNGRLAAKQLHDALRACGLDPALQQYTNLYTCADPGPGDAQDERAALDRVQAALAAGYPVVGMGHIVWAVLDRAELPFLRLYHPAARGKIRLKANYYAHVQAILCSCTG